MGSPNLVFILLSHQKKKKSDGPEKFRKLHVITQKGHGPLAHFMGPITLTNPCKIYWLATSGGHFL